MHVVLAVWLAVASQQQKKCVDTFAPLLKTAKGDALLTAYSQLGGCLDDAGAPKPDYRPAEGDFGVGELLLSMAKESRRDLDTLQREVLSLLNVLYDKDPDMTNFTGQVNMPFFKGLVDRQLTDDFVVIAFSSVAPEGSKEWVETHGGSIEKTIDFINEQNH